ncbi:flagellar hook assembly protein FlgD [Legionella dresdenensis]|uniref:Basal-body rod modification protein FlgD n=1 Tax=Legionella dresdenensis TaxID=450200 RepID=A0ABV8CC32_9GAMM
MVMNPVNSATSSSNYISAPSNSGTKKTLGQEDFMRLMVAQIQNQDPMQPSENGEFLSQMAQFSATDGITKMQQSLDALATSLQSNQALQASALVGRKVLVSSNTMQLGAEGSVKATADLPVAVGNLSASIYSSTGELINKIPLGAQNAGLFEFSWDGTNQSGVRVPAGNYTVKVSGNYGGQEVALKTLVAANVDSVSLGQNGDGIKLNVAGVGSVSLDQVRQISA